MIIITKSGEGHYGYYLSIIQKHFNNSVVIDLNDIDQSLPKIFVTSRKEKFVVLNGDYLMRKKPFIFLLILTLQIEVVQIFYNIDFIYKNNLRSFFLKNIFKIQKAFFKKIKNLTLVDHSVNDSLGLLHIPDPIDIETPKTEIDAKEPFILLFGTHGPRKGTYNFLKKYNGLLKVIVVGKIVDERIFEFSGSKKFTIIDGFVDDVTKHKFFSQAECVAVPYIEWHGSSGVLGHAILYDKVIIGPKNFHIGKVLDEYSKSYFINTYSESIEIYQSEIEELKNKKSNAEKIIDKYYSEHRFVEVIGQ